MNKLLSIIIPVYNVEKYITKCLKSILTVNAETLELIEVLVVDDGSTDQSGRIADEFARKYQCVNVIHKQNEGVAAARNTGIHRAHGKWLYFVDSDDWLEKGGVRGICEVVQKHTDVDVLLMEAYQNVGHKQKEWVHFSEDEDLTNTERIRRLQGGILYAPFWRKAKNDPMGAPWDKVYRRDFLTANHLLFCERLKVLDDMVFNFEVLGAARKVACRKIKPYHYRRFVTDSITNTYKPDRVSQDKAVWNYLFSLELWNGEDMDILQGAMMCRMIKSFSICCRLCFFNRENKRRLKEKAAYVKHVIESEPYYTAFHTVRLSDLEWKLKVVALTGRLSSGWGMYLLHAAWETLRFLKGQISGDGKCCS
ncbi:MAG: glycosyltransferase [Lachnospiraceae bacterium]|nr:glycosyltransferase [Lachnospiraceae bacterium]